MKRFSNLSTLQKQPGSGLYGLTPYLSERITDAISLRQLDLHEPTGDEDPLIHSPLVVRPIEQRLRQRIDGLRISAVHWHPIPRKVPLHIDCNRRER
jgi:hypothetical protein